MGNLNYHNIEIMTTYIYQKCLSKSRYQHYTNIIRDRKYLTKLNIKVKNRTTKDYICLHYTLYFCPSTIIHNCIWILYLSVFWIIYLVDIAPEGNYKFFFFSPCFQRFGEVSVSWFWSASVQDAWTSNEKGWWEF